MQVSCDAANLIGAAENVTVVEPPTIHATPTFMANLPTAVYAQVPTFSMLPCVSANMENKNRSELNITECGAYASQSDGEYYLAGQLVANTTHAYCDDPPCVACNPTALSEAACLPGVYVIEYSLPLAALPQGVSEAPATVRQAFIVAEGSKFSVRIDFPAPSASAAEDVAAALAVDEATLANVSSTAQAQAFVALADLNATTSGRVTNIRTPAPQLRATTSTDGTGSPVASLEVSVEFQFVPGYSNFTVDWPDGVSNSTANTTVASTAQRRLLHAHRKASRRLLERHLQQTDASSLQNLLQGLSSSLSSVADSIASNSSASDASASAGASGSPTATAGSAETTTPAVTAATILRAEVTIALADASQGLITSSLELLRSLEQVNAFSAILDGDSGIAREHFLSSLNSWNSFSAYMDWLQVHCALPIQVIGYLLVSRTSSRKLANIIVLS